MRRWLGGSSGAVGLGVFLFMFASSGPLVGCSSPEKTGLSAYFDSIAPFEETLAKVQQELDRIAKLPTSERRENYEAVGRKLEQQEKDLQALVVPEEAQAYHGGLLEMFRLSREFMHNSAAALGGDRENIESLTAERRALSENWGKVLGQLQTEQAELAKKHGLHFE